MQLSKLHHILKPGTPTLIIFRTFSDNELKMEKTPKRREFMSLREEVAPQPYCQSSDAVQPSAWGEDGGKLVWLASWGPSFSLLWLCYMSTVL